MRHCHFLQLRHLQAVVDLHYDIFLPTSVFLKNGHSSTASPLLGSLEDACGNPSAVSFYARTSKFHCGFDPARSRVPNGLAKQ